MGPPDPPPPADKTAPAFIASLQSAIPGSVGLWVHQKDADKAIAALKRDEEQKGRRESGERHPRPTSDQKPSSTPHRKEPHVKQDPAGE